jgi:PST family polysaccharide transporter
LPGQFATFILAGVSADLFPRLAAAASSRDEVNRMVNEQTEVGIYLSLPGLLAALALGPVAIQVFYSSEFLAASALLSWFVLGVFGRVISYPMEFVLPALGNGRLYVACETAVAAVQVTGVAALTPVYGLEGAAAAYAVVHGLYILVTKYFCRSLTQFQWTLEVRRLMLITTAMVSAAFLAAVYLPTTWNMCTTLLLVPVSAVYCIRGLSTRLGPAHKLSKWASRLPYVIPRAK